MENMECAPVDDEMDHEHPTTASEEEEDEEEDMMMIPIGVQHVVQAHNEPAQNMLPEEMESTEDVTQEEQVDVEDGSPDSLDGEVTGLQTPIDSASKNRSKRKPSKTQIKHYAPPKDCDTSRYGTENMEDLFKDVTQGMFPSNESQISTQKLVNAHQLSMIFPNSLVDGKPIVSQLEKPMTPSRQIEINSLSGVPMASIKQTPMMTSPNESSLVSHNGIQMISPNEIQMTPTKDGRCPPSQLRGSPGRSSSKPPPCYPCGICGKVFRVPSRYDAHMLGHSKGKPFCCSTCGKMFSSQDKLDQHLPVHSTDRATPFTCDSCGKVCVNWRAYLYHLKAKHSEAGGKKFTCNVSKTNGTEKRFSCNICGRQFHTGQRLRNHMASHEIGKNHCCQTCGKLFESQKKLDTHVMVHDLTSKHDQHLVCKDCGREYTEWIAFKQHMKTHSAEGVQYPCGLCEMVFPTQYEKEKHKRVHKQVQCEFCERYFRSASVLSVHLRVHTGERPYKCGLCERDFSQSSVLKVHMRTHRKEETFQCKRCGNIYADVMEFFRHHMTHLEENNLQCEECGKLFDNINNKNRHMAAHRNRSGRVCQICGKEFGRMSHLEAHMLCHADQLPLLCKVCGKLFPSPEVLTAHYATHLTIGGDDINMNSPGLSPSSNGPLFCGLCGKMFKGQVFLDNHMKKHETEGLDSRGGEEAPDEGTVEVEGGEFACVDCGKSFGIEYHLAVHTREHTGERPHTCILCGLSFMLRKQLLDHITEHKRNGLMMFMGNQVLDPSDATQSTSVFPSKHGASQGYQETDTGSETESDDDDIISQKLQPPDINVNLETSATLLPRTHYRLSECHNQPSKKTCYDAGDLNYQTKRDIESTYPNVQKVILNNMNGKSQLVEQSFDKATVENDYISQKSSHSNRIPTGDNPSLKSAYLDATEKRFLENLGSAYSESAFAEAQKLVLSQNQSLKTQYSNNTTSMPYDLQKQLYNSSFLNSNHTSTLPIKNNIYSDLPNGSYDRSDLHISNNDISAQLSVTVKANDSSLDHILKTEVNLQNSVQPDYQIDINNYNFPYDKEYLTSSASNAQIEPDNFLTSPSRISSEPLTASFQLLPQTAFPDSSVHD